MNNFKLLLAVFGFLLVGFVFGEVSRIKAGCHNFVGAVKCKNGSNILKKAVIQLYETDIFGDDLLETRPLIVLEDKKSAKFAWRQCYFDGRILFFGPSFPNLEVYYVFKNVCQEGDSYLAVDVLKQKDTYVLHDGKAYLV